jgi:hypothetical protein
MSAKVSHQATSGSAHSTAVQFANGRLTEERRTTSAKALAMSKMPSLVTVHSLQMSSLTVRVGRLLVPGHDEERFGLQ